MVRHERPRVLLLTGGPLDGTEGSDVRLASDVLEALPDVDFVWFARWPDHGRDPPRRGRPVRMLSRDGVSHVPQRVQAVLAGAVFARRVDLVHAFLSVGSAFPVFSWLRPLFLGGGRSCTRCPGSRTAASWPAPGPWERRSPCRSRWRGGCGPRTSGTYG